MTRYGGGQNKIRQRCVSTKRSEANVQMVVGVQCTGYDTRVLGALGPRAVWAAMLGAWRASAPVA